MVSAAVHGPATSADDVAGDSRHRDSPASRGGWNRQTQVVDDIKCQVLRYGLVKTSVFRFGPDLISVDRRSIAFRIDTFHGKFYHCHLLQVLTRDGLRDRKNGKKYQMSQDIPHLKERQ